MFILIYILYAREFMINTKMVYWFTNVTWKQTDFSVKIIQKYASLVHLNKWHFLVE